MPKEVPLIRPYLSRTAKARACAAIKASSTTSSKRFPRNVKPLELIAEVNETNAEINGKIANETLQNSSVEKNFKKKESLKRQRDDEKYEKNEKQISKKPKAAPSNETNQSPNQENESHLNNVMKVEQQIMDLKIENNNTPKTVKIEEKIIHTQKYSFGMLDTDDSTDDEEEVDRQRKKRPPPPEWSLPKNRLEIIATQSNIDMKIVDKLFGIVEDVDLTEIFPGISKNVLKRRPSSFYWNSPVHHSMLPKY